MHSILLAPAQNQADEILAELYEMGTAGIIEEDGYLRAFFDDSVDSSVLLHAYEVIEMRREDANGTPEFDRTGWEPILAGDRFFIAPSWIGSPTPEGRFRLTIDDSGAFGTGRHESTQLMLRAMEQTVKAGDAVLDVGAGSGILSVAASMLGAGQVFSCDIHADSVRASVRAFALNAFAGSADAIGDHAADLTLANISARVIDLLAFDLKRVTKPTGRVLLSGFIKSNPPRHFRPVRVWEQDEWQCWLCLPRDIDAVEKAGGVQFHPEQWW